MKEFFKPTIAKLLLTFLLPFFFAVEYAISKTVTGTAADFNLVVQFVPFLFMLFGIIALSGRSSSLETAALQWPDTSLGQKAIGILLELVLPFAVSYLLACGIIFAYQKGRARVRANVAAEQAQESER